LSEKTGFVQRIISGLAKWPYNVAVIIVGLALGVILRVVFPAADSNSVILILPLLLIVSGSWAVIHQLQNRHLTLKRHLPLLFLTFIIIDWIFAVFADSLIVESFHLLTGILAFAATSMIIGNYLNAKKDKFSGFFKKIWLVFLFLLAFAGIAVDFIILLVPLMIKPVFFWLGDEGGKKQFYFYGPLLIVIPTVHFVLRLARGIGWISINGMEFGEEAAVSATAMGSAFSTGIVNSIHELDQIFKVAPIALLMTAILVSAMILTNRMVKHAGIRWKLTINVTLSGIFPGLLLAILFTTSAVVVLGNYRARLVVSQLDRQKEMSRLVTIWFAEAWADPLDRQAQMVFEDQMRSLSAEGFLSKAFFSIYLPERDTAEQDSLLNWRVLASTWRKPSDFAMDKLQISADWKDGSVTGYILDKKHLFVVALVEREGLLSVGFFPFEQEELEKIGEVLGTEISLNCVLGEDQELIHYSLARIGMDFEAENYTIKATPDFPDEYSSIFDKLFTVGMCRVDNDTFPLANKTESIIARVEAIPSHVLPRAFSNYSIVDIPYIILLGFITMTLIPMLMVAVWIAWLINRRITRSINELEEGTAQLAAVNLDYKIPENTTDELGMLARSFNYMSHQIAQNIDQLAEKERMERELTIARTIQEKLLPDKPPTFSPLDICSSCRMAQEVGGDYYDLMLMSPDHLAFALGDVSGKGVAAALLMSNLQAAWRSLLSFDLPSDKLCLHLNEQIAATTADEMFITFVHGKIVQNREKGTILLDYSNAGHNPPLILRQGQLIDLDKGGICLGMFPGMAYESAVLELLPGDWLIMYTDGLTEALNPQEEEYGEDRLRELLVSVKPETARELVDILLKDVAVFENGEAHSDDLTTLVIHYKGKY
jgi:serine phosphatase RsbU (regulator of sigma subunit)